MSVSYGVLSTYPPTQCGLATFSHALVTHLTAAGKDVGVVRVVDAGEVVAGRPLSRHGHGPGGSLWVRDRPGGAAAAAAALNRHDVAVIQHEYGIFPGPDGREVLQVVRGLRVPTITVLHTVLVTPSESQRQILDELAAHSSVLVTMTRTARDRLVAHYAVDPSRVVVIPHGAEPSPIVGERRLRDPDEAPTVLTWGLLGEGKGIEWAIDAMPLLADLRPRPHYRVVGETHPKVKAQHGEAYRQRLVERARTSGGTVHFDGRYLTATELHQEVARCDVVLLPYDSREQVTSGVLIEAVTAGKPVVSTAFPHAVELLSSGAGLLVERQNPAAIAAALRQVFTEPGREAAMAAEAGRIAPDLLWPAVADRYRELGSRLVAPVDVLASA
ncbi:glycosyltransferase [uncultured Friedmanniella sp.]|uniref:glycosyltransferase n=1 Tax=uncultured Friedmanniella sp. TaxID=335381 RepID=UPI0035CBC6E3